MRLALWEPPADRAAAIGVLRRAVELGVNLIDTADVYGLGANEELIADALHPYPDDLVIATKAGGARPSPSEWIAVGRPEYLRQQAELSLRRLWVDSIGLFQLHRIDERIPLEDQLGAFKQLQDEGKIRHIGLSEVSVAQLEQAASLAPIATVQNQYSVADRRHEPVLRWCEGRGIGFLPWEPLGVAARPGGAPKLDALATEMGASSAQVALAWLLHHSEVTMPIPGTSAIAHLEENFAARELALSSSHLQAIGSAFAEDDGR